MRVLLFRLFMRGFSAIFALLALVAALAAMGIGHMPNQTSDSPDTLYIAAMTAALICGVTYQLAEMEW